MLVRAAAAFGERPAVTGRSGSLTFGALLDRARRVAGGLLALGLRPGDRVLEALPNDVEVIAVDIALSIAGLVRVPLNPRLGPREWSAIAADCGARALVLGEHLSLPDGEGIDSHLHPELLVLAGRERCGGSVHLDELAQSPPAPVSRQVEPDDLAGVTYSSGTTGLPKGTRRTHRMRLASAQAMAAAVIGDPGRDPVYLHAGPAIHTSGLFTLPFLAMGGHQVLLDHPRPAQIAAAIEEHTVTHLAVVPTVLQSLADLPDDARSSFVTLRMAAYAGAPMSGTAIRRAVERVTPNLVQYYGSVEAMPPLSVLSTADHARGIGDEPGLLSSAGRPVDGLQLRIVDEQGKPVAVGDHGEITVRGAVVSPGYWGSGSRDDLPPPAVDGWLLTGDIGHLTDGYLYLTDRRGDLIISGGYNVYPREVETVAATVPGVKACAVVGVHDERWGQVITLVYVAYPGHDPGDDEFASAFQALARHKRPRTRLRVTQLPLGATGKIDRRAVLARVESAGD